MSKRKPFPEVSPEDLEPLKFYFWIYPREAKPGQYHKRCLVQAGASENGDSIITIIEQDGSTPDKNDYDAELVAGKFYGPVDVP